MRKLWNRPDIAVWSLVTLSNDGIPNMNICTYVSAVSMDPKLITIALFEGTKTLANITVGSRVLLQLLTETLAPIVRICGQQSGHKINKISLLKNRYQFKYHDLLPYLTVAAGYMELAITDVHEIGGDHTLVTGKVISSKNLIDAPILTTTYLKDNKFTR